jgi:hypothetical protein
MSQHAHIPEEILAEIWKEQHFVDELFAETGEKIEVIFVGDENKENGGPDFLNARIKIGNLTYVGDVEIDNSHADWKTHGHNLNKRFNKVILHAIVNNESNQKYVYTQNGRRIHTFCFAPHVKGDVLDSLKKAIVVDNDKKTNKVHCFKVSQLAEETEVINYLTDLGVARFKKKCEKLVVRLRELIFISSLEEPTADQQYAIPEEAYTGKLCYEDLNKKHVWEQLFYESIFEALGYSQNKNVLMKLSQIMNISLIDSLNIPKEHFIEVLEGLYFVAGGILPTPETIKDPVILEYVRKASENWTKYCAHYEVQLCDPTEWHFFKLRPQNFPTVRVAAGTRIVFKLLHDDLIPKIMKKFYEIHNYGVLKNLIRNFLTIKGDGFWKKHYTFDKSASGEDIHYFLGTSRADEMFINVILPFAYVYFDLFDKKKFAQKTIAVYCDIACDTENSLVTEVADALHIEANWKKSVIYQGMIELFRNFCAKDRCEECQIGKIVFSEKSEV